MADESQQPVSREIWYQAQKFQADAIKDLGGDVKDMRDNVKVISTDLKKIVIQVTETNGRTGKLEDWTTEAKKQIENTNKLASDTLINYKVDRARIWTTIAVAVFLGGTIITLAIMQIDDKIKNDVSSSVSDILSTYSISK